MVRIKLKCSRGSPSMLEKIYAEVNDNIKFAEAKNAALITLNSAIMSFSASIIFNKDTVFSYRIALSAFAFALFIPLIISLFSFKASTGTESCFGKKIYSAIDKRNKIDITDSKPMYYAYIASKYQGQNRADHFHLDICGETCQKHHHNILSKQIIDLSKVALRKFMLFNIAVKIECFVFGVGGFGLLLFIIYKILNYIN